MFYSVENDNIPKFIEKFDLSGLKSAYKLILCSVNPKSTRIIRSWISKNRLFPLVEAGKNIRVPIRHKYRNINELGIDRQVNAFGALAAGRLPALIFDFGTALTVDVVSAQGVFEGGLIIPGPATALSALTSGTALLPKQVSLSSKGVSLTGRDTHTCIQSGIVQGYGAMSDGLVRLFKAKYGKNLYVIATGGLAVTIAPLTKSFDRVDPAWTLKSLALLYHKTASSTLCHK